MICTICGIDKDEQEFSLRIDQWRARRRGQCKVCKAAQHFKWAQSHRHMTHKNQAKWRNSHRVQISAACATYRLGLHGITPAEKSAQWIRQKKQCALCLRGLTLSAARIDHDHGCVNAAVHRHGTHGAEYGCRQCIRGILCDFCNHRMLPFLEKFSHMQNNLVRQYLKSRPYANVSR